MFVNLSIETALKELRLMMAYVSIVNCRWGMSPLDRNDQGLDSGGARETALGFNVDVSLVTVSHE